MYRARYGEAAAPRPPPGPATPPAGKDPITTHMMGCAGASPGGIGFGEVEEVGDIEGRDSCPQLVDRVVPEIVQRGR